MGYEGSSGDINTAQVVVVDDDAAQLRLMEATLSRLGYHPVCVNSPLGATNVIRKVRPALVLVDINMPALRGPELVKLLRANPHTCETPILFMSAQPKAEIVAAVEESGATAYIQKGAPLETIIATLTEYLPSPGAPAPVTPTPAVEGVEGRRRLPRSTYMAAWSMESVDSGVRLTANVTNVSIGGLALYVDQALEVGTRVRVWPPTDGDLGNDEGILGEVRWKRLFGTLYGLGIAFDPGSSAAHRALAALIERLPKDG